MAVEENPGILLYTRIRKSPYFYGSREHGVSATASTTTPTTRVTTATRSGSTWALLGGVTMWDVGVERQIVARHLSWLPNVAPDEYGQIV